MYRELRPLLALCSPVSAFMQLSIAVVSWIYASVSLITASSDRDSIAEDERGYASDHTVVEVDDDAASIHTLCESDHTIIDDEDDRSSVDTILDDDDECEIVNDGIEIKDNQSTVENLPDLGETPVDPAPVKRRRGPPAVPRTSPCQSLNCQFSACAVGDGPQSKTMCARHGGGIRCRVCNKLVHTSKPMVDLCKEHSTGEQLIPNAAPAPKVKRSTFCVENTLIQCHHVGRDCATFAAQLDTKPSMLNRLSYRDRCIRCMHSGCGICENTMAYGKKSFCTEHKPAGARGHQHSLIPEASVATDWSTRTRRLASPKAGSLTEPDWNTNEFIEGKKVRRKAKVTTSRKVDEPRIPKKKKTVVEVPEIPSNLGDSMTAVLDAGAGVAKPDGDSAVSNCPGGSVVAEEPSGDGPVAADTAEDEDSFDVDSWSLFGEESSFSLIFPCRPHEM